MNPLVAALLFLPVGVGSAADSASGSGMAEQLVAAGYVIEPGTNSDTHVRAPEEVLRSALRAPGDPLYVVALAPDTSLNPDRLARDLVLQIRGAATVVVLASSDSMLLASASIRSEEVNNGVAADLLLEAERQGETIPEILPVLAERITELKQVSRTRSNEVLQEGNTEFPWVAALLVALLVWGLFRRISRNYGSGSHSDTTAYDQWGRLSSEPGYGKPPGPDTNYR